MTASMGRAENDRQNKTAMIGLIGEDVYDRTAKTVLPR
jgi:hypothetical protein